MENSNEKPKRPSDKELIEQKFKRRSFGWRKKTKSGGVIVWYDEPKDKKKSKKRRSGSKKSDKRDKHKDNLYVKD